MHALKFFKDQGIEGELLSVLIGGYINNATKTGAKVEAEQAKTEAAPAEAQQVAQAMDGQVVGGGDDLQDKDMPF